MPNLKWSRLSWLKLGKYAEFFAKLEFSLYGFEVYTSEVDDHGVDFVAKQPNSEQFFEVQVKAISNTGYVFARKDKVRLKDNWLLCLLRFVDGIEPEIYIIPATIWATGQKPFVSRNYEKEGQKSKPEWGVNISKRNVPLLAEYTSEKFFAQLVEG